MNELKLIIEGGGVTRAAVLSENRPGIRIGSVSDCDIRLKRELFDGPVLVPVGFSGDGLLCPVQWTTGTILPPTMTL